MAGRGSGPDFVEALARGLDVIKAFRAGHPAMSLTEVAAEAGLAVASPRPIVVSVAVTSEATRAWVCFRPSGTRGRSPLCLYAYQVS